MNRNALPIGMWSLGCGWAALVWLCVGAATADDARRELGKAKQALQDLQQMTSGIIRDLPESALKSTLVDALAQTHKFTTAALSSRNPQSIAVGREIQRALLELARAEVTLRNLGELEELPEQGRIVTLAAVSRAQAALSEASAAFFNVGVEFQVFVKGERTSSEATAKVVVTNQGPRDLGAVRLSVIPAKGWSAVPVGKWTFTDLPSGDKRVATFALKPQSAKAGPLGAASARVSYFVFFGQATIEKHWTAGA
jgi:hypothetical protein